MLQSKDRVPYWIQNKEPTNCCLQDTHIRVKKTNKLKMRGWEKIFHVNGKDRRLGALILIKDNLDFKMKTINKYKGHYLMRKGYIK